MSSLRSSNLLRTDDLKRSRRSRIRWNDGLLMISNGGIVNFEEPGCVFDAFDRCGDGIDDAAFDGLTCVFLGHGKRFQFEFVNFCEDFMCRNNLFTYK